MRLKQLGEALDLRVHGDPKQELQRFAPIEKAGPEELSFVVGKRYRDALKNCKAGAVIVPEDLLPDAPGNALISNDPYASYAQASWLLYPRDDALIGVHPTAVVHPSAVIADSASIGPYCVIGANTTVAARARVDAHCTLGDDVVLGEGCELCARVTLCNKVTMGVGCTVQSGTVIGAQGFGFAWSQQSWIPIQQVGGVQIGSQVHIGAGSTIDCGAIEPTVIEDGVILDNQIQIAHNVHIGKNTAIAGCVGIAGSTRIGSHCQIGGACNIVGHLSIADFVIINAASTVTRSITDKGRYGSGMPLQTQSGWRRNFVNLGKLDQLFRRVASLERRTKDS